MLSKVCIKEGVALVNIVRKQDQVDLLTKLGVKFDVECGWLAVDAFPWQVKACKSRRVV